MDIHSSFVQNLAPELQETGLKETKIKQEIRKAIKDEWFAQKDEVKRKGKHKLLKVRQALDEAWRKVEAGKNDPEPIFSDDAFEHILEDLGLGEREPPTDNAERRHVDGGGGRAGAVAGGGDQDAGNAGEKDHEKEKRKGKGAGEQRGVEEVADVGEDKRERAGSRAGQGAQAAGGVGGISSRQESQRQVSFCMCACLCIVYVYVFTYMCTHVCVLCMYVCMHTHKSKYIN